MDLNLPQNPVTVRKILVVCMFDSVHTARWLSQFSKNRNFNIYLFPSRKFRRLNPQLITVLKSSPNIKVSKSYRRVPKAFLGYYTFFRFNFASKFLRRDSNTLRINSLKRILNSLLPDVVHALEIQGAGYLVGCALDTSAMPNRRIITNWGSDIYFYQEDDLEKKRIAHTLSKFTHYSAECLRDYELALKFGFKGEMLPCIPNGGGIELSNVNGLTNFCSSRNLMIVKAYGGKFGLGLIATSICKEVLGTLSSPVIYFYSVTKDVEPQVIDLSKHFPGRVKYSTVRRSLPYFEFIEIVKTARCYLGMSKSDGISTSFLEAISYGVYPIQTDTSCAAEWLSLGASGFVTNSENRVGIIQKIQEVYLDDSLVDSAQIRNREIAKEYLSFEKILNKAEYFYN